MKPMKVDVDILKDLADMNHHDRERLVQCVVCADDPSRCGCTEADEDENGMCLRYKVKGEKNDGQRVVSKR